MGFHSKVRNKLSTENQMLKIFLAEFLGTYMLILLGDSSVAQNVLSREGNGDFISVNIAWGLAVAMGVWVCGRTSGGHINPAITLAACIYGRCRWVLLPIYWCAQYLGALAASAVVYGIYYQAIEDFDGGERQISGFNGTAGIWATYPLPYLSVWGGLGDQIVSTSVLALMVLAITDKRNMKPHDGMVPFAVGLIVMVIGLTMGHNCGYAINPARDLAPRAFTAMAGWGVDVFTVNNYWCWVPIVGPHIGAVLGGWMYMVFVGNHLRDDDDDDDNSRVRVGSMELKEERGVRDPIPDYNQRPIHSGHGSGRENSGYREERF